MKKVKASYVEYNLPQILTVAQSLNYFIQFIKFLFMPHLHWLSQGQAAAFPQVLVPMNINLENTFHWAPATPTSDYSSSDTNDLKLASVNAGSEYSTVPLLCHTESVNTLIIHRTCYFTGTNTSNPVWMIQPQIPTGRTLGEKINLPVLSGLLLKKHLMVLGVCVLFFFVCLFALLFCVLAFHHFTPGDEVKPGKAPQSASLLSPCTILLRSSWQLPDRTKGKLK